jgi:hypothetical protein
MRITGILTIAFALILTGTTAGLAPAEAAVVSLEVTLDRSNVLLGDPVALRLAVTHPAQTTLAFPDVAALQSTGLEVLHVLPGQSGHAFADGLTTVLEYIIVGFEPREYVLTQPVLGVVYETPDGEKGSVQPQGSVVLTVQSVLEDLADPTLRRIRPPVALAEPLLSLMNPAAPVALAVAALTLIFFYARSKGSGPLPLAATPEQRARDALQAAALSLSRRDPEYLQFYTQVDTATRKYLAERTELPSLTTTTRELQREMERSRTEQKLATLIFNLLKECDAARWGHEYSGLEAAEAALACALHIIDLVPSHGIANNSRDDRSTKRHEAA